MAKKRKKKAARPRKPRPDCLGIQKAAQQAFCGVSVARFVTPAGYPLSGAWPKGKRLTKCQAEVAAAGLKTAKGILERKTTIMGAVLVDAHPDFKRARRFTVGALTALENRNLDKLRTNLAKAAQYLERGEKANKKACERKR